VDRNPPITHKPEQPEGRSSQTVQKVGQGMESLVRIPKDEILGWVWVKPNTSCHSVSPEASEQPEELEDEWQQRFA